MEKSASTRHPSVLALLEEGLPGEEAADVICRKARAVVAKSRELWKGPPFCPFELADLEGVLVEKAPCDIRSDGRIFSKGGQVYIQYTESLSHERIRFTICHELAHTLFPDCFKRERRRSESERAEWEFENLCNIGAAEFLFPLEEFSAEAGSKVIGGGKIIELSSRFGASIDATAIRYVQLLKVPASVVFAEYRPPQRGKVVSLFVKYSIPNKAFAIAIRKGVSINSKSIANIAYKTQQVQSAQAESWMVHGSWQRFKVEAIPLPKFQAKSASDLAMVVYPR